MFSDQCHLCFEELHITHIFILGAGLGVSPAVSNPQLNAQDKIKTEGDALDRVSQCSNDSRRQSEIPPFIQSSASDPPDTWSALAGQMWDNFMTGYTGGAGSEPNSKSNSLSHQGAPNKSLFELLEDFYSNLPKRPPGAIAMEIIMTSCSRCLYCNSVLYDEEIMSGWTAEDSNLNTKCAFCDRMVVPFLTIQVVDFRTRSLSSMENLMTPAQSLECLRYILIWIFVLTPNN